MKNKTIKRFNVIMSLLLVLALAAPVITPPSTAEAATKKQTVGAFTLKVPSNWTKTDNSVAGNIQYIFTSSDGIGFIAQSTEIGANVTDEQLKPILKAALESQFGSNVKNVKYSTKKTGIGKAVMVSFKVTQGAITLNCKMYAVCKGGYLFMGIGIGTSKKTDTKILKSVKLK